MEPWLQNIAAWLPSGGLLYTLVGVISFIESLAFIGILCPGSVLIVFAGFLAATGDTSFAVMAGVAAAGSFAGDLLSYLLGARLATRAMEIRLFHKRRELLRKSQVFFLDHGGKSVFFGRFIGFLRPFIPFVAGSSHMPPLRFTCYAAVSGVLWGIAYPGLGYFFGASWQMVKLWSGRFSLFFLALLALVVLNGLFWKKVAPRLAAGLARLWRHLAEGWQRWLQRPAVAGFAGRHPRLWAFLADRFNPGHGAGLYLTVGLAVSLLFALLFLWLAAGFPSLGRLNTRLYALLQTARHPAIDTVMLVLTSFGSGTVVAIFSGLALVWLVLDNRDFSAVILLAGVAGGELLVALGKFVVDRPRPTPFLPWLELSSPSLPSGHAFTALVFYGLVVYFLLDTVRQWQSRLTLILSCSCLASLVGFSRIYLGVHWLSDVLAGFALAAVWLTFLVTATEARRRFGGEFPWRAGWQPLHLTPRTRTVILALAALAALAGYCLYLRQLLEPL
jgi:undecaprenyl-diphosphatase